MDDALPNRGSRTARQRLLEDGLIEENHNIHSVILCEEGDIPIHGRGGEKAYDLLAPAEFGLLTFAEEGHNLLFQKRHKLWLIIGTGQNCLLINGSQGAPPYRC